MVKKAQIQAIKSETEDSYSDDSLFNISSWGADLSFRELISRYEEDELVKPELQRNYIWDKTEASRFIDSLLLGLPVPSIFLAKTENEKMLIVDGYQRIMTVHDFTRGIFSLDGKVFKLSNSDKINIRWRGKAFSELSAAEQRKIRNTTIHSIIFVQEVPEGGQTSLFQVFERINTSGRSLMAQEIRNCVYQGRFNMLLFELNEYPAWRKLFGSEVPEPRMRDMEFILRFFALQPDVINSINSERLSLKKHLNLFMKKNKDLEEQQAEEYAELFKATIEKISDFWGESAFHNLSPTKKGVLVRKFSPTIFDSISIATSVAMSTESIDQIDNAEEKRRELLSDPDYRFAIMQETMRIASIKTRTRKAMNYLYGIRDE